MSGTHKLVTVLVLTAAAVVGCTATAPTAVQEPKAPSSTPAAEPASEATPTRGPTDAETCSGLSEVYGDGGGLYWERRGTLRDLGAREFARGTVTVVRKACP